MRDEFQRKLLFFIYSLTFVAYILIGLIAAHPYDDEVYAQHAQYFYHFLLNPAYNLPMGLYYDLINIGGYFVTILFSIMGISNVLTIQIGVKISFIVFTFLTSYFLYKITDDLGFNGHYAALLLLTSPIYLFTSVIYGSAIVISIFFLVASLHYLFKERTVVSAILFGISAGTYLYPIFSIPFLLRYIYIKEGRKQSLIYFLVTTVFFAIGQLSVFFIYLKSGYYSISPSSPTQYVTHITLPFYSVFDVFNLLGISDFVPGLLYAMIYYLSSLIASLSYFLVKKDKVDKNSIVAFLFIQGVLFAALNPVNLPSYMSAMVPFAVLLTLTKKNWWFLGLTWLATFFSFIVMQTINNIGFLVYFSDVNVKIDTIHNSFPNWINSLAGSIYSVALLSLILPSLRSRLGKSVKFSKSLISQFSIVIVLVIVSLVVVAPVMYTVPSNLYLSNQYNVAQAQPTSEFISGHSLYVNYKVPVIGFLGSSYLNHFIGVIQLPTSSYVMYNTSKNFTISSDNYTQLLSLQYPLENAELDLFGNSMGELSAELINGSNILLITPTSSQEVGQYSLYQFNIKSTISGIYILRVNSTVPLYAHNSTSLSIKLAGNLGTGNVSLGNLELSNGYINGRLLKTDTLLKFDGPFREIPPALPSLYVYPGKYFGENIPLAISIGAVLFLSTIILPVSLVLRSTLRSKRTHLD